MMPLEPLSAEPVRRVRAPVFIQTWAPVVFLHWPVEVAAVEPWLPPGCVADTLEGVAYVGLIPLVIRRVRICGAPPIPHLSTFVELKWARMSHQRSGDEHVWRTSRRWPGPVGAHAQVRVQVGRPIPEPDPLTVFLTARWQLHTRLLVTGRTAYVPAEHPSWPLFEATVLDLDEDVIVAAGLPAPVAAPHVLFSPGVTVRIGRPIAVGRG